MATPFAAVADVQARTEVQIVGPLVGIVQSLLDDASIMVRGQYRTIDADIAAGSVDADSVLSVVARMVKRALESGPDGVKSDTAGPFGVTYDNPAGNLYLTAQERLLLGVPSGRTAISAYM